MPVRMITIKNPFNRKERDIKNLDFRGQSLQKIKDEHTLADLDVVISINGMVVEKEFWDSTIPRLGDEIVFMPVVSGGGGGDKDILGAVLMIALVWAVGPGAMLGANFFAAEAGLVSWMVGAAIVAAGGILINSLMPGPQTPKLDFDAEASQIYRWQPHTVNRQGIVVPKFYGKNKLYGNVISVYTEPDDSDDTKQLLYMLVALGAGPVKGITKSDGSNYDITINGQKYTNYNDVSIEEKRGTLEQTVVSLFSETKPEYRPFRVVTNSGGSEVYTTPDNDFDDLEVELCFDRGIYYANNQGGLSNHNIDIKIEVSEHDADDWSTLVDDTITDDVTSSIRKSYTASENYTGGSPVTINRGTKYDIRVSKDTSDETSARYGDRLLLGSVREILEDGFKYPGRSLLAIQALATDQLSGSLEVDVIQEGAVVRVYDDETETWSIEYSNNPAWVLYDILTQPVISGDGGGTAYAVERYEGINPNRLDLESFVALADFCNELVPDGNGGTEKRITFNGGFDTATTMWEAALKVCEIARCIIIQNGTEYSVVIDKSTTVTQMFSVGNIIKDSFKRTFLAQEERASEVEVHYRDELQDYERVPFTVYNSSAGSFENKVTLELFGITKQSEAWRAAMFRLAQNILLKSIIEFEADIDAIACTIGDVIYVQHDVPDWKEGGRVVSSTNNTVVVDKEVTASGGTDKILVRVYNPSAEKEQIEEHTVSSVDGTTITITDTWTTNPSAGNIYCYGTSDDTARKYRVIGLSRSKEQRIKITAIEYNEEIYTYDSDDPTIPISDYDAPTSDDVATKPPSFDQIRREYPKYIQGLPTMDVPITQNLAWSGNESDTISWAKDDDENPILLTYKGVTYEITADSSTNKYIYWDKNDSNNTFHGTDTLANAIGSDKWLMAYNDEGTAYPAFGRKIIHGGLIQADTITASQIIVSDIKLANLGEASNQSLASNNLSNLLDNPNFELGDSYWKKEEGWSIIEDATNAYVGNWVAKYQYPGEGSGSKVIYQYIKVSEGEIYEISGYVKNGAGSNRDLHFYIILQDKNGATVSAKSSNAVTGTTYTKTYCTVTIPATAVRMYIGLHIHSVGAGSIGYFDMAIIHEVHTADHISETDSKKWAGDWASGEDTTYIDGGKIYTNTITADKYAQLRNTYVYNGDDSLDSSKPFEVPFKIVSELVSVVSVKVSFKIMDYRAYSTGAESGGGSTSGSGGGQTSSSGGGQTSSGAAGYGTITTSSDGPSNTDSENLGSHYHTMPSHDHRLSGNTDNEDCGGGSHNHDLGYSANVSSEDPGNTYSYNMYSHSHGVDDHDHTINKSQLEGHTHTVEDHTHTISNHTHSTPNHAHDISYGIHEESNSPTVHFHIDNGSGYGDASDNYTTDQLDIDITEDISGDGWKSLRFDTTARCRIAAIIECKLDITA